MRTAIIIAGGFVLLGLCLLVGRRLGGANTKARRPDPGNLRLVATGRR